MARFNVINASYRYLRMGSVLFPRPILILADTLHFAVWHPDRTQSTWKSTVSKTSTSPLMPAMVWGLGAKSQLLSFAKGHDHRLVAATLSTLRNSWIHIRRRLSTLSARASNIGNRKRMKKQWRHSKRQFISHLAFIRLTIS